MKKRQKKTKRDIQFRLERVDESPRIKLRLILLFLIAETTASTGGASARKAKTPWSLLRLVSSTSQCLKITKNDAFEFFKK